MLRNPPRLKYNGLTVVLSNPSRHDRINLLTANGGVFFNNALQPEFNQMGCDIRLMEDNSPWREGTKCILLCGEAAMHKWIPETKDNVLNEMRGSPFYIDNIPAMATFFPQDCVDTFGLESRYNELSKDYSPESEESHEGEDGDEGDVKRFSFTKQSNFSFWSKGDIAKCKKLLTEGGSQWPVETEPTYRIYPSSEETIKVLTETKKHYFYFDIETEYEEQNLLCFSFGFYKDGDPNITIYSIPILNHEYRFAYSLLVYIIKALAIAIRDNIVVGHNISHFDLLVFIMKYRIAFRRAECTMIMQHRCFPAVEKSLGHCMSRWTYQKFHKDVDSEAYFTQEHMMQKLRYCGKDVFGTFLVHQAIKKYAKTIPGLEASIALGNRSIKPYLTACLQGLRYSETKRQEIAKESDRLMTQYLRIINMLIGPTGLLTCKQAIKSGKPKVFPRSNKQCANYFHEQLGYDVVQRSKKTGEPSLGAKNLYKLAIKHPDNPVITFTNLFRGCSKEYSTLQFNPWRDDNNRILPRTKVEVAE